jgi:hypothetical protein
LIDYLLVLIEEDGTGPIGGHLSTLQPGPQILVALLKFTVVLKGQYQEFLNPYNELLSACLASQKAA